MADREGNSAVLVKLMPYIREVFQPDTLMAYCYNMQREEFLLDSPATCQYLAFGQIALSRMCFDHGESIHLLYSTGW